MSFDERKAERNLQSKFTQRSIKRASSVTGFPKDSVPFHVPHRNNLLGRAQLNPAEPTDYIHNLRPTKPKSPTRSVTEIKKRAVVKRSAKFTIQSEESLISKKESSIVHEKKTAPVLTDLDELIETRIKKFTGNEFIYLKYSVEKTNEYFTAYCLVEVPYKQVDRNQFYTMSKRGVTLFSRAENQFTPMNVWQTEYRLYRKLMLLRTFQHFRIWKGFKVWHKSIRWRKFCAARKFIEQHLFTCIAPLGQALLRLRLEYCRFMVMSFVDDKPCEQQHLFYYIEAQMMTYEAVRDALVEFRERMSTELYRACLDAILLRGFQPIDEVLVFKNKMRQMMSFTDRANKRRFCILLTNFLCYCDYMTITFLHELLKDAFDKLSGLFIAHHTYRPTAEDMLELAMDVQYEHERPPKSPQNPLFNLNLVLNPESFDADPSRAVILYMFHQLVDLINESIFAMDRFQSDDKYLQFHTPSIMGRQEDRLGGKPLDIHFVINNDRKLNENREFLFTAINEAFDTCGEYVLRFESVRASYEEDVNTDPKTIRAERRVSALRDYCQRYNDEMQALTSILPSVRLGLYDLNLSAIREEVIPVCRDLLHVLDGHIPKIAVQLVDELMQEAEDVMYSTNANPETTIGLVEFMRYFDECDKRIKGLLTNIDFAYDCFILMNDFNIFVDEAEKEKYMDCEHLIIECKERLLERISTKGELVEKLDRCLQEDIKLLFDEVNQIQVDAVQEWLIDENSSQSEIYATLAGLNEHLAELQAKAQDYRKYQKEYKIDLTRFDPVDHAMLEVKNRQLLWETSDEWTKSITEWHEVSFNELNVETLTDVCMKLLRNCNLLEKNLPANTVIPRVRHAAEEFKDKLPVIQYLRNPNLKTRHWLKIESLIDRKVFADNTVQLGLYEEAGAFTPELLEPLAEVSGQATAEQGLEMLLKKVEYVWKEAELSVIGHRESKDVFILGGLDELQILLDESYITINTLASSRNVGPIKARVDDWQRVLELFTSTLDEWSRCQSSWIYLEAIFSAPDIQRQLPTESRMFLVVDKAWKELMRRAYKQPLALPQMTDEKTHEMMKKNNVLLDKISKCLDAYLEVKRVAFPRFYFLSNDELLEILAQTRNPHAVQPHLRKCFDAIAKLQFGTKETEGGHSVMTNDIIAIISPEGEKILLGIGLKARGPVEDWLGKVEENMFTSLKRCMKFGYKCYEIKDRSSWFQEHANQIVLSVSQQQWAADVHAILDKPDAQCISMMKAFEKKLVLDLQKLAAIARSDINKLLRKVLCALITVDVHARDTITSLVTQKVTSVNDFNWLKMLRYYWVPTTETMDVKMSSASLPYFYEYLGAGGVLVITPLTDRCYLCLMGALQMDLGGAPAGPAGTGKTETTKDLAKALAKQCVVFNCSDGLDYKMMGRFFSGLAQSGAWCCFDEFNRIDIEVLSVIAQQLITIRNAKAMRMKNFMFEGREIKLDMSCAAFITMNPGYAGRTELPDNLKALFRPMAMMVPDYGLIAEVILFSEGFDSSKKLALKMVQMYKLCSEQLSQQDHYDFGMRAVKSVLVMAGALKRAAPNQSEDITLISALRDSNLPKFLSDDAILFKGILSDLFPGIELPVEDYGALQQAIVHCMEGANLQPVPDHITKNIQLYETMCVRWGVMLVGPTGGGKTSILHTLGGALSKLYADEVPGPNYRHVRMQTLNPKSISADELYGAVNSVTLEWKDGLLGLAVRSAVTVVEEEHQWIVCDGPVDAVWIENLNTVLDDNKMLCLANSERIKLTPWVHMVFEVQDLAQASPATVSRCGMVYVDPGELGWKPLVTSWRATVPSSQLTVEMIDYLVSLLELYIAAVLKFANKSCLYTIHQVEVSKVSMMCTLLLALTKQTQTLSIKPSESLLFKMFVWTLLWSIGGNFVDASRTKLEAFIRALVVENPMASLPETTLWDWKIDLGKDSWQSWSDIVPEFVFDPEERFFDILVPTTETTKFSFIAEMLFRENRPVMFTGDTGVGKSVLAKGALARLAQFDIMSLVINFSAQTSSLNTQELIESRLEKRKKNLFGPPVGKTLIYFVDDVNMPKLDVYGSQPPIELLRQFLDFKGLYDRQKMFWKDIERVVLGCGCAPPGGGRNPLTPRFVRHFALLLLAPPNLDTLNAIFSGIMTGFLAEFTSTIRTLAQPIVNAAISVYDRIARELLPTPDKSHYVFNLRDLSKCVQGILQADASNYNIPSKILRLFYHESMRVFHDRLINETDKSYFRELMRETCIKYFEQPIVNPGELVIFGDFMIFGQAREDRIYEEITDMEKLKSMLFDYLDDWNGSTGKDVSLVLFQDAVEHVVRLARLLRSERSNGLLVGLSGMGKQSLTRLGAHINGYKCVQIELCRGYDQSAFHDDLRKLYHLAGVSNLPTVFLITDTQIVQEEFLEDINNILNSGEVPGLFEGDDFEQVILGITEACQKAKIEDQSREGMFRFFINRVRANLHIVLCMSPVGDAFRRRCRMFPSLVNCCTIDWFVKWPQEALLTVSLGSLATVSENPDDVQRLAEMCVKIHASVEVASEEMFAEVRRHYYTTPSSYLELLKLYHNLLKSRTDLILAKRSRLSNGLNKILSTNQLVAVMEETLTEMAPMLELQSSEMSKLVQKLTADTATADAFKANLMLDEADATEKAVIARGIADEANKDLAVAQPALKAAEEALKAINKNDINELKSFAQPPPLVQFVMESVCILFGAKPSWDSSKKIMADVNFLKKLIEFDKEHISEATLKKLKAYIDHKDYDPVKIEKVSRVAKSVSLFVVAMDQFAKIYKVVEPKIKRARNAEAEHKTIMAILKDKQAQLAEIEGHLQILKDNLEIKQREFKIIQDNVDLTMGRLNRAGRLTSALADEEVRWGQIVEDLTAELFTIPGDVMMASAYVAYIGAFPVQFRKRLSVTWAADCKRLMIPSSDEFNLVSVLGDAYEIRSWNMSNLPRDEVSIENGIVVTKALRWPLMIDPQEQANRWIRSMEEPNSLCITKITDPHLMRHLETCIRQGLPMLIEDVEETIDPSMAPVLGRNIISQGGNLTIKLGDTSVEYDPNFKLYMTTKLSNPHYLPEVCVMVTLVNFLVTVDGLEDQLLAEVIAIELPAMEKQRNDLIIRINQDKQQLLQLEDRVLKLLFAATGNILDDEELVETLNESKETSATIAARLIDTEETEKVITTTREKYRILAARGAVLFFVVASLAEIDPMYQYSLKYFTSVFCAVIAADHAPLQLAERLATLMVDAVYAIYMNMSRGLFERHKLVFSFLLAMSIERQENRISGDEFDFFLRGPLGDFKPTSVRNEKVLVSNTTWVSCDYLEQKFARSFGGLLGDLTNALHISFGEFNENIYFTKTKPDQLIKKYNDLKLFHKLMLINTLAPQMCIPALSSFIQETLGKRFTDVATNATLPALFADTTTAIPLIFILSTGSDPMGAFLRFTADMNFLDKFHSISLGQGQGPAAELLMEKGRIFGHWVFLQNCHLATSWMSRMELIIKNMTLGNIKSHPDFRLYLSSMPSQNFPVSVLQNSVKVTNEPPKGLKATLVRAFADMDKDFFEKHALAEQWRAIVFGVCMFHGVILERRKFGPLGWNITYEFTESDRESGLKTLDMYCDRESPAPIPWDALLFINGEITWGGRVTDYWDQRCLKTILKIFGSERVVEAGYQYSSSGIYRCPDSQLVEGFREYAASLPFNDDPEIFGMHENANLVFQTKETTFFLDTIMSGQPKTSGGGGGSHSDDIVMAKIEQISSGLAPKINSDNAFPLQMQPDEKGRVPPLTTVLLQETDRFNKMLVVIHDSLVTLRKAIRGLVVMSEILEKVYFSLLDNQVPLMWHKKGFLSTKSLGFWLLDFQYRIDFVQTWMEQGLPSSSWLSGMFFPQSFLTGTLQTHARKNNLPIDSLLIDFEVLGETVIQSEVYAGHSRGDKDGPQLYNGIVHPDLGIVIHGLFIEAGRWDPSGICDSLPGQLVANLPAVWIKPCTQIVIGDRYQAPLYKTQVRAGVLSTTGHSTNFVLTMFLKSKLPADFWILRGTALVTAVTE